MPLNQQQQQQQPASLPVTSKHSPMPTGKINISS